MSVASAVRAPVRRALCSTSTRRISAQFRASSFRGFSTEAPPPPPKKNFGLYAGLGAVAAGGIAYYLLNSDSESIAAKPAAQAAKFVPTKTDYDKACKTISEMSG